MSLRDARAAGGAAARRSSRARSRWPRRWSRPTSSPGCARRTTWSCCQFNNALERDRAVALGQDARRAGRMPAPAAARARTTSAARSRRQAAGGSRSAWRQVLQPRGTETRLGQALEQLIHDERSSPICGDRGVQRRRAERRRRRPRRPSRWPRRPKIPIFPVGVGSERRPASVRVNDFKAPARAYPGDRYTVTGFVQAQGLAGPDASPCELLAPGRPAGQRPRAARHGRSGSTAGRSSSAATARSCRSSSS